MYKPIRCPKLVDVVATHWNNSSIFIKHYALTSGNSSSQKMQKWS